MPLPWEFPSLGGATSGSTSSVTGLAPHPITCLVLQVGDTEKFSQALRLESVDPFLRVSNHSPRLTAVEEDGDDNRLVQLELACEADGVASTGPV